MSNAGAADRPTVMVGTSGAEITVSRASVRKIDVHVNPGRVTQQGEYMWIHGPTVFPIVFVRDHGYIEMEKLLPIHWSIARRGGSIFEEMVQLLGHLWDTVEDHWFADVIHPAHFDYMLQRAPTTGIANALRDWCVHLYGHRVKVPKGIHGDATVDNVMQKKDGSIRFIDPIPADGEKIPRIIAVDLGKMMQSAWGYERIRDREFPMLPKEESVKIIGRHFPSDTQDVAKYFLAVHLVRLLPYQPANLRPMFRRVLDEVILEYCPL